MPKTVGLSAILVLEASDNILASADTERTAEVDGGTHVLKRFKVKYYGTVRVSFEAKVDQEYASGYVFAKVWVDGNEVASWDLATTTAYQTFTVDVEVFNSTVEIGFDFGVSSPGYYGYIRNAKIKASITEATPNSRVSVEQD